MNSSFSDDGNLYYDQSKGVGRKSEDGKGLSVQAEYSDRGKNYYHQHGRISEVPDESDNRRSTPPGTIGEIQDIMSENIETL